ncbi:Mini-ribonuclease 3 [bacterium]|nr:Mini-ribonuclease 3 [bacterium]
MEDINLRNYAYLGDAVWELFIREKTILQTNNAKKLHKITTELVKTNTQCELLHNIENCLTEEEQDISKRARNLPIPVGRRNIQLEYRQATAFEALIGWWYTHDKNRYDEIINILEKFLQ